MPWRDLRRPGRGVRIFVVVALVFLALAAVLLTAISERPGCSLEAPQFWHRLTGCRIVFLLAR